MVAVCVRMIACTTVNAVARFIVVSVGKFGGIVITFLLRLLLLITPIGQPMPLIQRAMKVHVPPPIKIKRRLDESV